MKKSNLKILGLLLLICQSNAFAQQTRTETDLLGPKQIPADASYGVQTAHALENFQISGVLTNAYPDYVNAYARVKLVAARASTEVGRMKPETLAGIEKACRHFCE